LIAWREWAHELDLKIAPGLADADAVFLREALQQLNALLQHTVPAVALRVVHRLVFVDTPFAIEGHRGIFTPEIGAECLLKGSPEEHSGPGVFLLPAIQIAVPVPARAVQVMADLGIGVGHQATSEPGGSSVAAMGDNSFHFSDGAKASKLR